MRNPKKLVLNRETLRLLQSSDLEGVAGGTSWFPCTVGCTVGCTIPCTLVACSGTCVRIVTICVC
jgi:hypothetical protein